MKINETLGLIRSFTSDNHLCKEGSTKYASSRFIPQFLLLLLVGGITFEYYSITSFWWMFDDTQIVSVVMRNNLDFFYKPASESGTSWANFTPWLYFNYWIDVQLFGLNTWGFGFHQLLSVVFVVLSLYLVLKGSLGRPLTLLFLAWFFITPVSNTIVQILCTRHYLEGLGFSALSIYCYSKYMKEDQGKWLLVSAGLYAIACLNKEVYVPLICVIYLLILLDHNKTHRFDYQGVATFAVVAALYVAYRGYSLGWDNILTGYGGKQEDINLVVATGTVAEYITEIIRFNNLKFVVALSLIITLVLSVRFFFMGNHRPLIIGQLIFVTYAICILVPVYKVMSTANVNHNYIFLSSFVLLLGFFYLLRLLITTFNISGWLLLVLFGFTSLAIIKQYHYTQEHAPLIRQIARTNFVQRMNVEGEYMLRSRESTKLLKPWGGPWHADGIYGIRKQYFNTDSGPSACDDICECGDIANVVIFKDGKIVPVSSTGIKCLKL